MEIFGRTIAVPRRWLAGALAVTMMAGAAPMLAQGPGHGPGGKGRMGRGGPGGELLGGLRQLGLTDGQRSQVRAIMERHRDEFQSLGERARIARQALRDAETAEQLDEAAIRTASAAVAEVEADHAVLRARVHQEVWNTLTPEQREKAKSLRAERQQRMEERQQRTQERLKQRSGGQAQ